MSFFNFKFLSAVVAIDRYDISVVRELLPLLFLRNILPHNCIKGALSGLKQFLADEPFKNDEKCFLFHRESSFHSQDI